MTQGEAETDVSDKKGTLTRKSSAQKKTNNSSLKKKGKSKPWKKASKVSLISV